MIATLYVIHWVSALVIAVQASDRIFQCPLRQPGLCFKQRLSMALKGIAWALMAFAAMGALVAPMLRGMQLPGLYGLLVNPLPSLGEIGMFFGFAVLVVRSWVMDAVRCKQAKCEQAPTGQRQPVPATSGQRRPAPAEHAPRVHAHLGGEPQA